MLYSETHFSLPFSVIRPSIIIIIMGHDLDGITGHWCGYTITNKRRCPLSTSFFLSHQDHRPQITIETKSPKNWAFPKTKTWKIWTKIEIENSNDTVWMSNLSKLVLLSYSSFTFIINWCEAFRFFVWDTCICDAFILIKKQFQKCNIRVRLHC